MIPKLEAGGADLAVAISVGYILPLVDVKCTV